MERIAFVGATGGHFATTATVRRLRRLNPLMASGMRSFSFLQPVKDLVAQLNEFSPTVLATYPTAALMLAEEAAAGRLRARIAEVWTGGEALTASMRKFISETFVCPVAQSYGASEFFSMASECRFGSLHLNSDWLILESVDEHLQPVPDGREGFTSLLTNLANHVQPVIRYDLGDRITLHRKGCACGCALPVIEVQGRVDDSLLLRAQEGFVVRLLPLALTTVLEEEAKVFDFQIVQTSERTLLMRVAADGEQGTRQLRRARHALERHLLERGLIGVVIDERRGEASQPGRSGKLQRVVAWHGTMPEAAEKVV
jgi:phenylacetate-coenzyme A ligase PaaK-like adenylate-forming protein